MNNFIESNASCRPVGRGVAERGEACGPWCCWARRGLWAVVLLSEERPVGRGVAERGEACRPWCC